MNVVDGTLSLVRRYLHAAHHSHQDAAAREGTSI